MKDTDIRSLFMMELLLWFGLSVLDLQLTVVIELSFLSCLAAATSTVVDHILSTVT